jgi:hypothetical protein
MSGRNSSTHGGLLGMTSGGSVPPHAIVIALVAMVLLIVLAWIGRMFERGEVS